jgi:NTP pyrophosphatase (non-canonical NTP hydrolase)
MLSKLQREVAEWGRHNFPDAVPWMALMGVVEEIGELAHAHLKEREGIRGTSEQHHAEKIDAIGDTVIFLAHYCALSGIDFEQAVNDTWAKVCKRDWTKDKDNG